MGKAQHSEVSPVSWPAKSFQDDAACEVFCMPSALCTTANRMYKQGASILRESEKENLTCGPGFSVRFVHSLGELGDSLLLGTLRFKMAPILPPSWTKCPLEFVYPSQFPSRSHNACTTHSEWKWPKRRGDDSDVSEKRWENCRSSRELRLSVTRMRTKLPACAQNMFYIIIYSLNEIK